MCSVCLYSSQKLAEGTLIAIPWGVIEENYIQSNCSIRPWHINYGMPTLDDTIKFFNLVMELKLSIKENEALSV